MGVLGKIFRQAEDFLIVVTGDECEWDTDELGEIHQLREQSRGEAGAGVEEIAGDDELVRAVQADELGEAGEIAGGIALWDRQAVGTEGCGFPEVDVGSDEVFFLTEDEQSAVRQKMDRHRCEILDEHDYWRVCGLLIFPHSHPIAA